jgi:hypothetical protein
MCDLRSADAGGGTPRGTETTHRAAPDPVTADLAVRHLCSQLAPHRESVDGAHSGPTRTVTAARRPPARLRQMLRAHGSGRGLPDTNLTGSSSWTGERGAVACAPGHPIMWVFSAPDQVAPRLYLSRDLKSRPRTRAGGQGRI